MNYTDNIKRDETDTVNVIRSKVQMMVSDAYNTGNWEVVEENVMIVPGQGNAHLYAIPANMVIIGEWIYNEQGQYIAERIN